MNKTAVTIALSAAVAFGLGAKFGPQEAVRNSQPDNRFSLYTFVGPSTLPSGGGESRILVRIDGWTGRTWFSGIGMNWEPCGEQTNAAPWEIQEQAQR